MVSCDESPPPDPNIEGGAGIRFTFPAGTDTVGARLELWGRGYNAGPIPAPDCQGTGRSGWVSSAGVAEDACTRMSVRIRDWIGESVLSIPDTTVQTSLAWPWDQKDDAGNPVPSGIYSIFSQCLDRQGSFTFSGYYYVATEVPSDSCHWILWSRELPAGSFDRTASFGPFLPIGHTETFFQEQVRQVGFENPFLVRVLAPGMQTFEREITLLEGKYADVHVVFLAAASKGHSP